jgi:hypothetical protein
MAASRPMAHQSASTARARLLPWPALERTFLCRIWVIRVDITMCAAWSAIHNTGHYHVRLRPVWLPPSCARSANNGHSRRSSRVPASVDRATHDARSYTRRVDIATATNLHAMSCRDAEPGFCLIAVWRRTAQDRRGAHRRPSEGKIKGREVRGGRVAEERRHIKHFTRGAK